MNFLQKALMKNMVASQAKNLPPEMQTLLTRLVDEKPDLLITIGNEIAARIKRGEDQMAAVTGVLDTHRAMLQEFVRKG